jgi:hypothetical protein
VVWLVVRQASVVFAAAAQIHALWNNGEALAEFTLQVDLPTGIHGIVVGKGSATLKAIAIHTGVM